MFLDTGSSTTVVPSVQCGSSCPGVTTFYQPNATFAYNTGYTTSALYGGGAYWTGQVWSDVLTVGGYATFPSVRLNFAAATNQSGFFHATRCTPLMDAPPYGALLGLGPPELTARNTHAWTSNLWASYPDLDRVLSFQLCVRNTSGFGRLWVGRLDSASYSGTLLTTPLVYGGGVPFYKVTMNSLELGSPPTSITTVPVQYAIDTGTTVTMLPPAVFNALKSAIEASLYYQFTLNWGTDFFGSTNCRSATLGASPDLIDNLPPLVLHLDGMTLTLPASKSYLYPYGAFWCSGISPTSGLVILGASFMAHLTVSINLQTDTVGFAQAANCRTSAPVAPSGYFEYVEPPSSSSGGLSDTVLLAIAVGAGGLVFLILIIALVCCCGKSSTSTSSTSTPSAATTTSGSSASPPRGDTNMV